MFHLDKVSNQGNKNSQGRKVEYGKDSRERGYKELVKIAMQLNSETDLNRLLQVIVQESNALVQAEQTILFLVDHEQHEVYAKAWSRPDDREVRLPLGRGIAGMVAFNGEL